MKLKYVKHNPQKVVSAFRDLEPGELFIWPHAAELDDPPLLMRTMYGALIIEDGREYRSNDDIMDEAVVPVACNALEWWIVHE